MKPYYVEDEKKVEYSCCCTNLGCFGCGQDEVVDDIGNIGLGISIYFKIIKTLIVCFLLITIINIPLFLIYFFNESQTSTIKGYRDILYKTTLANMASSNILTLT